MRSVVVAVGQSVVNYLGLVTRLPDLGEEAELVEFSQQGGGAAATAAAALAVLGAPTRFLGKVADDHFGDFLRVGLGQLGVDLRYTVIEKGRVSPFSFTAVEEGTGRRTLFWSGGNTGLLDLAEVPADQALEDCAVLLIDGHLIDVQLRLAQQARERGATVVWDAHTPVGVTAELLRVTDVLVASERFTMEITESGELQATLAELSALGPATCIITLGDEGAVGRDQEHHFHREPSFPVKVRDTTGVGPVYCGAYVYAILQRWPLPRAMRFAAVMAGLECTKLGARAGIPGLAEIETALERYER